MKSMHCFADLLSTPKCARDERRIDDPRTYAIHPHAGWREFERRVARQSHDAMLRRIVSREPDASANTRDGRRVNDRAAFLRDHHLARIFEAPENSVQID